MLNLIDGLAELRPPARAWAESVLAEYDLNDTGRQLVLEGARCIDIVEMAREEARTATTEGRYKGTARTHPAIVVERSARQDFLSVLKQLGLEESAR
jgi:hypothetical protein